MEVVSEHDEPIIFDTMGEGRFFGEVSPRPASIRLEPIGLKVKVNDSSERTSCNCDNSEKK